jgi:hypothetical protein
LNLIPFGKVFLSGNHWDSKQLSTSFFPTELCVILSRQLFHQVAARWIGDLYSDKTTTHQGLWCHASVCPVESLVQIEVLARVRPDLTFEHATVDEAPIGNDGPGTPTTALNADRLWFLVGK